MFPVIYRIKYGVGALREVGNAARYAFGLKRVALMTDVRVRQLPFFDTVHKSLLHEVCESIVCR